jgi:hypothetical protein
MTGPERRLWNWFRDGVREHSHQFHMQRIESVGTGIPDVEICWKGICFWFELKYANRPKKTSTRLQFTSPLTLEQQLWQEERIAKGGTVFNMIKVGEGSTSRVYVVNGTRAKEIPNMTEQIIQVFSINQNFQSNPFQLLAHMLAHVIPSSYVTEKK